MEACLFCDKFDRGRDLYYTRYHDNERLVLGVYGGPVVAGSRRQHSG
jgi:hypothetical protein